MSKNEGSHDPRKPWTQNHKMTKIIKNPENKCFFQHGKDAHRDFEKGALNESSRSLIWSFWEQIVFLEIGEKVRNLSKLAQNVPRPQNRFYWVWIQKNLKIRLFFEIFRKYMKFAHEFSVQDGSYAFPNELMRFRNEAKAIWGIIQKHCKHAVII